MEDPFYIVYVLYSKKSNAYYTGYTTNLIRRFHEHNKYSIKGYTKNCRPWIFLYSEIFLTKTEALKREKYLKTGVGRDYLNRIIKEMYGRDFKI